MHPQIKAFIILYSKLNSSVAPLTLHKKIPDQNPMQSGQRNNSPNFPVFGLTKLNIDPYNRI